MQGQPQLSEREKRLLERIKKNSQQLPGPPQGKKSKIVQAPIAPVGPVVPLGPLGPAQPSILGPSRKKPKKPNRQIFLPPMPIPDDADKVINILSNQYNDLDNIGVEVLYFEELGRGTFGIAYRILNNRDEQKYVAKLLKCDVSTIKMYKNNPNIKILEKRLIKSFYDDITLEVGITNTLEADCSISQCLYQNPTFNIYQETGLINSFIVYQNDNKLTSLFSFFDKNKLNLTLNDKILIIGNLIFCIKKLHEYGISHNDLKPENCLIDPTTHKVYVIDYGLSCLNKRDNTLDISVNLDFNKFNEKMYLVCGDNTMGTMAYMPFFVVKNFLLQKNCRFAIRNRNYKYPYDVYEINDAKKIDLWSVGIMLFEIILKKKYQYFITDANYKIGNYDIIINHRVHYQFISSFTNHEVDMVDDLYYLTIYEMYKNTLYNIKKIYNTLLTRIMLPNEKENLKNFLDSAYNLCFGSFFENEDPLISKILGNNPKPNPSIFSRISRFFYSQPQQENNFREQLNGVLIHKYIPVNMTLDDLYIKYMDIYNRHSEYPPSNNYYPKNIDVNISKLISIVYNDSKDSEFYENIMTIYSKINNTGTCKIYIINPILNIKNIYEHIFWNYLKNLNINCKFFKVLNKIKNLEYKDYKKYVSFDQDHIIEKFVYDYTDEAFIEYITYNNNYKTCICIEFENPADVPINMEQLYRDIVNIHNGDDRFHSIISNDPINIKIVNF